MAMSLVGAGAVIKAASGNRTPVLHASTTAGDLVFVVAGCGDNVVCTLPAGWTKLSETNSGATCRLTIGYKIAVFGEAAPVVTHTAGNSIGAFTITYRMGLRPYAYGSQATTGSATITAPTLTTNELGSMIVFFGVSSNADTSTAVTTATYAATNPSSLTERVDDFVDLGTRLVSISCADGLKTNAGATGAATATSSVSGDNVGVLLALSQMERPNNYQSFTDSGGNTGILGFAERVK